MTDDQIIQISKDLLEIQGTANSPHILIFEYTGFNPDENTFSGGDFKIISSELELKGNQEYVGPWLRNSIFDGKWSSAAIREGLKLDIWHCIGNWRLIHNKSHGGFVLNSTDPSADELAQMLGIIEYHKQFPQEVEDYLEGLK